MKQVGLSSLGENLNDLGLVNPIDVVTTDAKNLTLNGITYLTQAEYDAAVKAALENGSVVKDPTNFTLNGKTYATLEEYNAALAALTEAGGLGGELVLSGDDEFVPFGEEEETAVVVTPPDEPEIVEEEEVLEEINYTLDDDGNIVCNNDGYVYNSTLKTCVPSEEDGEPTSIIRGDGTTSDVGKAAPKVSSIGSNTSREARSLGFQNGGSVGLDKVADNFLRAMQGAG